MTTRHGFSETGQSLTPGGIGGIHKTHMTNHEGRAKLGHQFFKGVGVIPKAFAEFAGQAGFVACPVGKLMQGGGVVACRRDEAPAVWQANLIPARRLECSIMAHGLLATGLQKLGRNPNMQPLAHSALKKNGPTRL